ncbi:hypothetical protein ES703_22623 [subsurface metagenome]
MKVIILILIKFFFISALFIISNENLYLREPVDRETFFNTYSTWLGNLFSQSIEVAGSVINLKWLPDDDFSQS